MYTFMLIDLPPQQPPQPKANAKNAIYITEAELSTISHSPSQGSEQSLTTTRRLHAPRSNSVQELPNNAELAQLSNHIVAEKRMAESWSPKVNSMIGLVPPDPDFVRLKRRLKRSRDNIRQSRTEFFSSPSTTRTPTPNESWLRKERNSDTLWEQEWKQIDRLSVPSISVTHNNGSPMSQSDREDELDGASTSSLSLRYFSDDDGVELRQPSDHNLYPAPVTRSQSFQGQGTFSNDSETAEGGSRFTVKRVISDDVINPASSRSQGRTVPVNNLLSHREPNRPVPSKELHVKPHMVSRLMAKMRLVTLDWRRANRSQRGELPACNT